MCINTLSISNAIYKLNYKYIPYVRKLLFPVILPQCYKFIKIL